MSRKPTKQEQAVLNAIEAVEKRVARVYRRHYDTPEEQRDPDIEYLLNMAMDVMPALMHISMPGGTCYGAHSRRLKAMDTLVRLADGSD